MTRRPGIAAGSLAAVCLAASLALAQAPPQTQPPRPQTPPTKPAPRPDPPTTPPTEAQTPEEPRGQGSGEAPRTLDERGGITLKGCLRRSATASPNSSTTTTAPEFELTKVSATAGSAATADRYRVVARDVAVKLVDHVGKEVQLTGRVTTPPEGHASPADAKVPQFVAASVTQTGNCPGN
jgi:hypothetical protein